MLKLLDLAEKCIDRFLFVIKPNKMKGKITRKRQWVQVLVL